MSSPQEGATGYSFCFPTQAVLALGNNSTLPTDEIHSYIRLNPHCQLGLVVTAYADITTSAGEPTYTVMKTVDACYIRHLCLQDISDAHLMLAHCTRVVDLSLAVTPDSAGRFPFIFIHLEYMPHLTRLAAHILRLLGENFTDGCLTDPVFANITHLTLFDDLSNARWHEWRDLRALPALTHLCLNQGGSSDILSAILIHCRQLKVLLNRRHTGAWSQRHAAHDLVKAMKYLDDRLVIFYTDCFEWPHEWQRSVLGRPECMWKQARRFIRAKRERRIEASVYWMTKDSGLQLSDDSEVSDRETELVYSVQRELEITRYLNSVTHEEEVDSQSSDKDQGEIGFTTRSGSSSPDFDSDDSEETVVNSDTDCHLSSAVKRTEGNSDSESDWEWEWDCWCGIGAEYGRCGI
ncbi:hypothetical protein FB45DRAFT_920474 [Roridomyces roridus]|uniref:Uncharacterized protein n=1 Tax=Roridomyces roridus TaxID=1738132 RepID=A0AAD7BPI5_9AGAR|nr:hypothetical protein FB45DRAFT_920474 [Roridomyces roridus]